MTTLLNTSELSNSGLDITFTVLMAVFCLVVVVLAVWLLTKFIKKPKYIDGYNERVKALQLKATQDNKEFIKPIQFNFTAILLAVIGVALVVRLLFTFLVKGFRPEYHGLVDVMLNTGGLTTFFTTTNMEHYPLIAYIYGFLGVISRGANLDATSIMMPFMVKLPMILADIGLICLVYFAAKKFINEYAALILAGFVALFPPFILASSIWGSIYSIMAILLALTFYFVATKKILGVFIAYTLALLTAKDALFLFPIVATFVIYQMVKSIKYMRKNEIQGFKNVLKNKETRNAYLVPMYIVGFFLVSWLLVLPIIRNVSYNPFVFMHMIYFNPLANFQFFGFNALNLFNLFGFNGRLAPEPYLQIIFSIFFALIIASLVIVVYISRKNRANLVYFGAFVLLTLSIFFLDFGALNIISVLAILMLALIFIRDKRILLVILLVGILMTLNASFIFMQAGYLNNDAFPSQSWAWDINSLWLLRNDVGYFAASLVLSILMLITYIVAIIVIVDIAMSNKRRLFTDKKVGFLGSLKKFIKE